MSESSSALPLDKTFWEHVKHIDFVVAIPVAEDRMLNIVDALHDIYNVICSGDQKKAEKAVTALAAILVASKYGKAAEVWEEYSVQEAMDQFDDSLKGVLDDDSK